MRYILRFMALILFFSPSFAFAYIYNFAIDGDSSSHVFSECSDTLTADAMVTYNTIGYRSPKFGLFRNGDMVEEKRLKSIGIGSVTQIIRFETQWAPGDYRIRATGSMSSLGSSNVISVQSSGGVSQNLCPVGEYDGANCLVMPETHNSFVYGDNVYVAADENTTNCPLGHYDGANCYFMNKPSGGFIYENGFYVSADAGSSNCSVGTYDGANCFIAKAPIGTEAFEYAGNFYTTPQPECPDSVHGYPTKFDGANCLVASSPGGTSAFTMYGNHYFTPNYCD